MKPYDASNPEHVEAAQKASDARGENFKAVLRTKPGRAFLHNLIFVTCHIGLPSFKERAGDATAFNEGGRAIGLALNDEARAIDKDLYLLMLKENM